ncbi:MAG: hypothetical protein HOP02_16675, partial [Methylococcaceae bacterium]|nr:hypothetical protein [Methylococcaceae bacterium]
MKKAFIFIPLVAMTLAYSSFATADGYYGGEHRHHGHHHGHGHHRDYDGYSNQQPIYYQAPPVVQYYAPPPQVNYYQAPQPPV